MATNVHALFASRIQQMIFYIIMRDWAPWGHAQTVSFKDRAIGLINYSCNELVLEVLVPGAPPAGCTRVSS